MWSGEGVQMEVRSRLGLDKVSLKAWNGEAETKTNYRQKQTKVMSCHTPINATSFHSLLTKTLVVSIYILDQNNSE